MGSPRVVNPGNGSANQPSSPGFRPTRRSTSQLNLELLPEEDLPVESLASLELGSGVKR